MKLNDLLNLPDDYRPVKVAVPMANDPDIICCIGNAIERRLASFILIGDKDKILALAKENDVDVSSSEFIHSDDEKDACDSAARLVKDRKVDIMMKGLVSTSTFSKAFLKKEYALIPRGQLVSHIALFEIPAYHKLLIVTDAGLNISPNTDIKAGIIRNAIRFARRLGIKTPKIACVAANEKVNSKLQSTLDADLLQKMCERGEFGDAMVEGPFGLDIAVSKEAAEIKGVKSEVAGDPDILLLPGLDAANVLYKSLTQFTHSQAAAVIGGAKAPIVLTSRADSEEVKLLSLAMAARMC